MNDLPVGVIGGGIVGLAVGREIMLRRPSAVVQIFEKEATLGAHQTGHNSGVVHAGIYYKPGSLKAELCTRGRHLLADYCAERGIAWNTCGKLVVAVDSSELGRLDALERTATENGVPGLRRLDAAAIREVEPAAAGIAALHSPQTAITDFTAVARALAADIKAAGGTITVDTAVSAIKRRRGGGGRGFGAIELATPRGPQLVSELVICAGLHADQVAAEVDGHDSPRIIPFRGEYMDVKAPKADLVRGLIYPVPDPRYPFLGVHFTRRVHGGVDVGPNAVLAFAREGYRRRDVDASDLVDIVTWPGFWKMAGKHWRTGITEMRGSLSKQAYMTRATRYVPEIGPDDVTRGSAGVRAQAIDRDGSLVDDFRVIVSNGIVSVRNAPSPAATSSLAIAEHVVDQMTTR